MARSSTAEQGARRYGGLSPDERRRARRERLIVAGHEAFGTRGYAATTIEGLCAEAGVTARHFYEAFEGREALLRAVYDGLVERTNAAIREAMIADAGSIRDRIESGVRAFLASYLDDPRVARVACLEVVGVSAALEARRREVILAFAATIARAIRLMRPELAGDDEPRLETAALLVVGGANEVIVDWLQREDRRDVDAIARDFVALFSAMIRGYE